MDSHLNRRPLKARQWHFIQAMARACVKAHIQPNHISLMSIVFSALSAVALLFTKDASGVTLFTAAWLSVLFLLGRGACNILDGLVAIEGGQKTASGELFNDIPDRISDVILLVCAGYAINVVSWGPEAGWCAALLAVMTAYVRTLGRGLGTAADFQGPMGKTRRMVLLAVIVLIMPFAAYAMNPQYLLLATLVIISLGSVMTCVNRAFKAYKTLETLPFKMDTE